MSTTPKKLVDRSDSLMAARLAVMNSYPHAHPIDMVRAALEAADEGTALLALQCWLAVLPPDERKLFQAGLALLAHAATSDGPTKPPPPTHHDTEPNK